MKKEYLLALDEGTTSARAILFDKQGMSVASAQREFTQHYPEPGWVEQDAVEIYATQYAVMTECIVKSGVDPRAIAAIGITNQRETTIVWDRETGKPVSPAIVWQCRRTADLCRQAIQDGMGDVIEQKTGLRVDAYFSATKLRWILDHVEGCRERAEQGKLLFGTVDTWLLWKLTDGRVHATDQTNASRTMLYNIHTLDWDEELLSYFRIPRSMLPEVKYSSELYGTVHVMGAEIPIAGIAGDQQAALFGQGCFSAGEAKTTYGTGCFLLEHTGHVPVVSRNGLITTIAAGVQGSQTEYALEGSVFIGGAVLQWLRDGLGVLREARDSEYFARKVEDSGGVYLVPAFTGLGAPYWDRNAKGTVTGLTRGTRFEHLVRAALESIAYQTEDLIEAMKSDSGQDFSVLKVDGGAAANDLLMQFQADISCVEVRRPRSGEATALGAAFLAGLGTGFYRDREELRGLLSASACFSPQMAPERREKLLKGWRRAVRAAQVSEEDLT